MKNPSVPNIPQMILDTMADNPNQRLWTSDALVEALYLRYGRLISRESVRVHVYKLRQQGKLEQARYGACCLPGAMPTPIALSDWLPAALQACWPNAPAASVLRNQFRAEQHYAPALATFRDTLARLEKEGKVARLQDGWTLPMRGA